MGLETIQSVSDDKILVVDDNRMNLKVIQLYLRGVPIQLDTAMGGTECLLMTKEKKYDLIFMDHRMPGLNGVETLHMLRSDTENINCKTKVIALTANADVGMKDQYLQEGFDDYLSKPVEADKLKEMITNHLNI